ncbi:4,5-DOPA-extradiol-dioxygenase [Peptostreptococcus faecalis]|uniref:4,5-DOPA-extradiol-dioxygenase n=1 Tax=Peptostreptococcus faecalis TaxID=2045015 RepID=UPI000C796A16|nr:4,5-DOPA dioxygenase extradiol [Peptostreptococcus faecalis]
MRMPVMFLGHGSPMNTIEDNEFSNTWKRLGTLIAKPKYILCISAHWVSESTSTNDSENPEIIYDMYGFPEELYQVKYSSPGSYELAHRVKNLTGANIDNSWGIDHGTWSVLTHMFPKADIPVVQLSIDSNASLMDFYNIGEKLRPLRDENVLILCSGNVVHNLRLMQWDLGDKGFDWAVEFGNYIKDGVLENNLEKVLSFNDVINPDNPPFTTLEHFVPLLFAMGASDKNDKISVENQGFSMGSLSMTSYIWE